MFTVLLSCSWTKADSIVVPFVSLLYIYIKTNCCNEAVVNNTIVVANKISRGIVMYGQWEEGAECHMFPCCACVCFVLSFLLKVINGVEAVVLHTCKQNIFNDCPYDFIL